MGDETPSPLPGVADSLKLAEILDDLTDWATALPDDVRAWKQAHNRLRRHVGQPICFPESETS